MMRQGAELVDGGKLEEALRVFRRASELFPQVTRRQCSAVSVYRARGSPQRMYECPCAGRGRLAQQRHRVEEALQVQEQELRQRVAADDLHGQGSQAGGQGSLLG